MAIFRFLEMAAAAILDFWNFTFLTVWTVKKVELRHCAKFRQNGSNRCWDMAIFQCFKMAAAAFWDFRNFKFLSVWTVKRVELHQHAKFRQNRSNCGRDMAIFLFFNMVAAAISDFWSFKFFNSLNVEDVELRQPAKFRQNRSIRDRDITICRFFQHGGRPPSWICNACVGTTHEGHLVVFITVQNMVGIDAVVLIICTFFDFASLAWKSLFTPKN